MSSPAPPVPEPAEPGRPATEPGDGAVDATPVVAPIHPGAVPADPERPEGLPVTPSTPETRWKPWSAWAGLLAGFGGAIGGGLVIAAIAAVFGADLKNPPPAVDIASTIVQDGCLVAAALLFASMIGRPRPWQFGLRRPVRLWPAVGWTVLAYVAFIVFSAIWISALGLENTKDTLPQDLGAEDSTVALIAVAFLVTVVAPFAEEFFFRGFFFRAMANWRGVLPAAAVTGLVFGGIHAAGSPIGFLVPLAFLGFALCLLYAKTRSLYPCILVHCFNNSVAYGSSVDWTWQTPVAFVSSAGLLFGGLWILRRFAGVSERPAVPIAAARRA